MRSVNESFFYNFGSAMRPLRDAKQDAKLVEWFYNLFSSRNWLEWFLNDKVVPLSVCKSAGYKLLNAINDVIEAAGKPENAEEELGFTKYYAITNGLREFETVFLAEVQTLDTYFVSQTGIYKTSDLIEHAERIFPESILDVIPDHAVKDIRDCGKCLAFDLPTAAGFHVLRAAEALIREYMTIVVGTAPKLKSRNWGRYIEILRKHGADKRILAALDQIREMHRNPIMHPENFLSGEEAATLLGVTQGVIVFIAADIAKRKKLKEEESAQAALSAALTSSGLPPSAPVLSIASTAATKQLAKGKPTPTQSAS